MKWKERKFYANALAFFPMREGSLLQILYLPCAEILES